MEFCIQCGHPMPESDRFCGQCGASRPEHDPRQDDVDASATGNDGRWWLLIGGAVLLVVLIGFLVSRDGGVSTGNQLSTESPGVFAAYDGLASFCDRYESFLLEYDNADGPPSSRAFLQGARMAWLGIGFPDEIVGEARSVDDQLELLVDRSQGLDFTDPNTVEEWASELVEDPAVEAVFDSGRVAYEDIRAFANQNCR